MENGTWLAVRGDTQVAVSNVHRFGTDAILLADFAAPRRGETVCELGTGCGAIALRLCADGAPAAVHGVDIAPEAIALAQEGAAAFTAQGKAPVPTFAVADWHTPAAIAPTGSVHLVVCNPPYFPPHSGKTSADDASRLARHEQPDTLHAVCAAAAWLLPSGGRFCLCHRPERLPAVFASLTAAGLEPKRLRPVVQRPGVSPWLVLIEARRGGRPSLTWEPSLILENADGTPSAAYREIYGE